MIYLLLAIIGIYFQCGKRNRNKISKMMFSLIKFIVCLPFRVVGLVK